MKKAFKYFGIITLICFSFFYTDKVMTVVSEIDPLKIQITNVKDSLKLSVNEAIVTSDTIIPGTNGREVNIDKSYKQMKKSDIFNINLIKYDVITPEYTLKDNLDKYIIQGNINKKSISILFIINNDNNFDKIINILNNKNVVANFFIEYKYLNNNINKIRKINNHNIYSYQDNYTYDTLLISNNIIKRVSNNEPKYCLVKEKNKNNLNVCSYTNMYTVIPNLKGSYNEIKTKLENGSIILFDTTSNTTNELSYMIDFIISKGYNILSLEELLTE